MDTRIYGEKRKIEASKVKHFFESRFSKENPLASVMLRSQDGDDIAERRNRKERALLLDLLDTTKPLCILDIGCGMGRIYDNLKDYVDFYDGVDFAENYIEAANQMFGNDNVAFYQMSATDIDKNKLRRSYDAIIVTGLCVYLNDDEIPFLMNDINDLLEEGGTLYFRESISVIEGRLTLKDYPSKELKADYNAIYRTATEYEQLFQEHLEYFQVLSTDLLLDDELGTRKETNQRYWFMVKGKQHAR